MRYERKVHEHYEGLFGAAYAASPWFIFKELGVDRPRWCQPDGLFFDPWRGTLTVVECKLQHTADAWWQLRWLYLPVLSAAFPPNLWSFRLLEVVKWYDPAVKFPERVKLRADIRDAREGEFGVHIWKP